MFILTDHEGHYAQIVSPESQESDLEKTLIPSFTQLAHIYGDPKCKAVCNLNPWHT